MLILTRAGIDETLNHFRDAGQLDNECVVLWLGKRAGENLEVTEYYRPIQVAKADRFRIPPEGMSALQAKLRARRLMVAAQIHSHPHEAFHSEADDAWAIVRHEGAFSLVVPRFAADTTLDNFLDQTKVFQFSQNATWDEVPKWQVRGQCIQIT